MIDTYLVPEKTVVTAKGDGEGVHIGPAQSRVFLVTLKITDIIEQESIDVSIQGSTDGTTWNPKALGAFPQLFYRGEHPLLVDVSGHPDVKFLRAHWEVGRWGRGTLTPRFEFQVALKEVPADLLAATQAAAQARR